MPVGANLRYILPVLLLLPVAVFAQSTPQPTSPLEQALAQQLNQKMNEAIAYQVQLITAQRELDADRAKIADLQKQIASAKPAAPNPGQN